MRYKALITLTLLASFLAHAHPYLGFHAGN